jgi:hypothetical protein
MSLVERELSIKKLCFCEMWILDYGLWCGGFGDLQRNVA